MNEPPSLSQFTTRVLPKSAGELPSPKAIYIRIFPRSFSHFKLPFVIVSNAVPREPKKAKDELAIRDNGDADAKLPSPGRTPS